MIIANSLTIEFKCSKITLLKRPFLLRYTFQQGLKLLEALIQVVVRRKKRTASLLTGASTTLHAYNGESVPSGMTPLSIVK
jgi:hypothetical protein